MTDPTLLARAKEALNHALDQRDRIGAHACPGSDCAICTEGWGELHAVLSDLAEAAASDAHAGESPGPSTLAVEVAGKSRTTTASNLGSPSSRRGGPAPDLRRDFERILSPAIDMRSRFAKCMLHALVDVAKHAQPAPGDGWRDIPDRLSGIAVSYPPPWMAEAQNARAKITDANGALIIAGMNQSKAALIVWAINKALPPPPAERKE